MLTGIDHLWQAMEQSVRSSDSIHTSGWLLRRTRPDSLCPVYAAWQLKEGRRALLLQLPGDKVPHPRRWPQCRGLETLVLRFDGLEHFGVALKDAAFTDVFASLSQDLLRRLDHVTDPAEQASIFLGQLTRWQKFLSVSSEGLSRIEQQGLWGELSVLRDVLIPLGGPAIIQAWKGPLGAHQDFQFESGAMEIKTTQAGAPQLVRITSERELDDSFCPALVLGVMALDIRENVGEKLPELVTSIRSTIASSLEISQHFEDLLLSAGYLDMHRSRYMDASYSIRSRSFFHVTDSFPAITERMLPPGTGDVSYGLSVSACHSFMLSEEQTALMLQEMI